MTPEEVQYLDKVIEDTQLVLELELWDNIQEQEANSQLGWIACLKHYGISPDRADKIEIGNFYIAVQEALDEHYENERE